MTVPADDDHDDEPDPTPQQMDAMLHAMVWGSGTEQADAMTCGHPITMHDEDGCNQPFCGCNWGSDEIGRYSPADPGGGTCGRPLAVRRAEKGPL